MTLPVLAILVEPGVTAELAPFLLLPLWEALSSTKKDGHGPWCNEGRATSLKRHQQLAEQGIRQRYMMLWCTFSLSHCNNTPLSHCSMENWQKLPGGSIHWVIAAM